MMLLKSIRCSHLASLLLVILWLSVSVGLRAEPAKNNRGGAGDPQGTVTNSLGMKLVPIPAGEFVMGSPDSDDRAFDRERPQHRVIITKRFLMGINEVTQQEYQQVTGRNPDWFTPTSGGKEHVAGLDTNRLPVGNVTWEEAVEFCRKLSALPAEKSAGRVYRLPTEAEWEYACRAGTTTRYYHGNSLSQQQAQFGQNTKTVASRLNERPTMVGSFAPNAFGLYDMHGNVWEWCSDWLDEDYYKRSPTTDPQGPATGTRRINRGGSWRHGPSLIRSANRGDDSPTFRDVVFGFRVVVSQ